MFENDHNENGMENAQFDSQSMNDDLSVSGVENITKKSKGKRLLSQGVLRQLLLQAALLLHMRHLTLSRIRSS